MSGTSAAVIADTDKIDIRRFCGYEAYGSNPAGTLGWRFYTDGWGLLEYRMNNITNNELLVVQNSYLAPLRTLETAIPNAGSGLDVQQAAVFTRNPNEVRDRMALFDDWRRRLCRFFGVPPGPQLGDGGVRKVV